jgi:hypothetical protein
LIIDDNSTDIDLLFEQHTEWISKDKAGVPVELGLRICNGCSRIKINEIACNVLYLFLSFRQFFS